MKTHHEELLEFSRPVWRRLYVIVVLILVQGCVWWFYQRPTKGQQHDVVSSSNR